MLRVDVSASATRGIRLPSNAPPRARQGHPPHPPQDGYPAHTRLELEPRGLQGQPWHKTERRAREQNFDKIVLIISQMRMRIGAAILAALAVLCCTPAAKTALTTALGRFFRDVARARARTRRYGNKYAP